MTLYTTGVALILRMRVLLNRIRVKDRQIVHLERKELTDAEKGDLERIKKDFGEEMTALHSELDKIRALYHDEALWLTRKIDGHIANAIKFIEELEGKGFPEKEAMAILSMLESEIKDFIDKLGITEDELERVKNYVKELESREEAVKRKAA